MATKLATPQPIIKRIPLTKLTSPDGRDLVQVFRDRWWVLDGEQNTLWYRGQSPQCNSNEGICKDIRDKLYPEMSVQHVPLAFVPIKTSGDFDYDL